jgi:hypothetical protein
MNQDGFTTHQLADTTADRNGFAADATLAVCGGPRKQQVHQQDDNDNIRGN